MTHATSSRSLAQSKLAQFVYDIRVVAKVCAIVGALFVVTWINYDSPGKASEPYMWGGKIFFGAVSSIN